MEANPVRFGLITGRVARKVIEAVIPSPGSGAPEVPNAVVRVREELELSLPHFQRLSRIGLRLALLALEWLTMVLGPSWRPFSFLPIERRRAMLCDWLSGHSPLRRDLARAVTAAPTLAYYTLPEVWGSLDYHPNEWFADRVRRRQEILDELDRRME